MQLQIHVLYIHNGLCQSYVVTPYESVMIELRCTVSLEHVKCNLSRMQSLWDLFA